MKIAQIVCTFPPYKGGMGNSVYNLSEALKERGMDVTIFSPLYKKQKFIDELKVVRLPAIFKFGNGAILLSLIWKLRSFDIIHLHLPFLGGTLPVWFFSILYPKKKVVVTYHMDLVALGFRGTIFNIYKRFALPLILNHVKKIIVSSRDYAENSDIKEYKDKFIEIPFWVDKVRFSPQEKNQDLLNHHFIKEDEKIIGFVGGLDSAHYFKGVDTLLRAFKILRSNFKSIKLIIVGDGDMKAYYIDMANGLGLRDDVIFTGRVSDKSLSKYYNLFDVLVLPSVTKSEAFGIALLEAASCAKALVASDLPGVRHVVGDGGLLAKSGSVEDLKDKLFKTLVDYKNFGIRAKVNAEKYNKENIVDKVIAVYSE